MARYRIHFIASFDHIVPADSPAEAKRIAAEMQEMPSIAIASANGGTTKCAWNVIEFIGGDD